MEQITGYYNTFVVKIWHDRARSTMRGRIQHVSSQEYAYFLNLEDVTHFIVSHLNPPPNDSHLGTRHRELLPVEDIGDIIHDE